MNVQERMKAALRKFPAAVNVITLRKANGEFLAITATAVTVATLQPPTMLLCINRDSAFGQALQDAETLCINALTQEQTEISAVCAGAKPQHEREACGNWRDVAGAPMLVDSQASFVCRKSEVITYGTHYLVLAEVLSVENSEASAPLIYMDRAYGTFAGQSA